MSRPSDGNHKESEMKGILTSGTRITRRTVVAGAATIASSAVAAACVPGTGGDQSQAAAAKTPATIVYWCNVGQADWEKIEAASKEYAQRNPHHKMEASNTVGPEAEYGAKLITAFAGGAAPDVIWTTTRRIIPFQSAGGLTDLTPLYARSKIRTDQYYPQAIEEQSVDGKLYGISQGWGVGVLGINRNLFERAGITLRPDFDKTWTHAEFLDMTKRVAKLDAQGNLETWGVDYSETWPLWWDFGTDFLDKERKKVAINQTAAGSQALQFWHDLTHVHRVQPKRTGGDRPQGVSMWNTGRQALLGNAGPFVLAQWGNLDFNADIVLRPIGPRPRFHRWYTDAYSLWSGSKVKDAAWEFMAFAGTDGQKFVEEAGGRSIPGFKPVAETIFLQRKTLNINKQRWLDAAKEAKGQPLVKPWDEMSAIVSKYRNDLLDQKISSREASGGIEREVNVLLSQS
jgi:ABC-type glycerol-3-phosphate transport system substrate-binding protein